VILVPFPVSFWAALSAQEGPPSRLKRLRWAAMIEGLSVLLADMAIQCLRIGEDGTTRAEDSRGRHVSGPAA
jgi:hypothetical protein